jgi:hypothetical protein
MKTQVYTCDTCKQTKSENELCQISVITRGITNGDKYAPPLEIDICRTCLEKKGFVVKDRDMLTDVENKQNKQNLEDKIIDILRDIGVAFYD